MESLYVLVVARAWARLYRSQLPPDHLTLVYHQARFGGDGSPADDEELARSLCRLLRADRQTGKFTRLVMMASGPMLAELRRRYDGEWEEITLGRIEQLPARPTDEDVQAYAGHLLAKHRNEDAAYQPGAAAAPPKTPD